MSNALFNEQVRMARQKGMKEGDAVSKLRKIKPKKKGQKTLSFHEGGLHASTDTAAGKKISASKHAAAASGKLGPLAAKQENFYRNVLKH